MRCILSFGIAIDIQGGRVVAAFFASQCMIADSNVFSGHLMGLTSLSWTLIM